MTNEQNLLKYKNILIVDDDDVYKMKLKKVLEEEGATVYMASQLERAEGLVEGISREGLALHLIILEPKLPDCYGLMAIRNLHAESAGMQTPIIVVSTGFNGMAVSKMKLYSVVGYVKKPVLLSKLIQFTKEVMSLVEKQKAIPEVIETLKISA